MGDLKPLDHEDGEIILDSEPMEVEEVETVNTVENQQIEVPPSKTFTWTIENFSRPNGRHTSETFSSSGYKWRIVTFVTRRHVNYLSVYLDADIANLPQEWTKISFAVINQINSKCTVRKATVHQFVAGKMNYGFAQFMPYHEVTDPRRGFIVNGTVRVEVEVTLSKDLDDCNYNPKKSTGFVGLKNQGATCYMNSLLQTLYHIPYFRKAVYHMPTTENGIPSGSIPLALQSLFYKLQFGNNSVSTKELTKSFGWDRSDSFMQHDAQELNRVLCENIENKMKGTVVDGTIQKLFEGNHINYVECMNVDYRSTRKEPFYDLQLDVKGCQDVYASFDKYVEVERLEGDNKYYAEKYGLQDAKKGVLFINFPPVLQLQLKRFEYDFISDTMVKINDRYEFPLQLDLDRENGKYLSPEADRTVRNLYTLHSVLVHSGGVNGGHYYACIRPTLSDQWVKFDDESVTEVDTKIALEEQYGGDGEVNPAFNYVPFRFTKCSSAYMLVYIRESEKEKIICDVDEEDIAEHLRIKLKKELEEKEQKKKEKAEAYLYTTIKLARNEDLVEQIGRDIYFDLVDFDKVRTFRIKKSTPFNIFKEEIAKEFGIPVQFQRYWLWTQRQTCCRLQRPLTEREETQPVGGQLEWSDRAPCVELKLFLEVELGQDLLPTFPPEKTNKDIILFFKLYDPKNESLRFVGRLFVKSTEKPLEILTKLNKMAGFPADEEIDLYEELRFKEVICGEINKEISFQDNLLEDGDIICFQKSCNVENEELFLYPDIPSFLGYICNRQVVHFRSLEKPKEDDFSLTLSKDLNYDGVVGRVARQLGVDDPAKVRLRQHNSYSQQPYPVPIKYRGKDRLLSMLVNYNKMSDILYYEVLDIPLPELENYITLKVDFYHATKAEVTKHSIRLPKQSTAEDVIMELKTKVELSHPEAELRLLEIFSHKIFKIFLPSDPILNIEDEIYKLRAEEIPEEEKNPGPHDKLVHVYHFKKDSVPNQIENFGEPFFLIIHEGETLADIKLRIQKKLLVPDEEFSKWKFAFVSLGRAVYLEDTDVVERRFPARDTYGVWSQYIGLEHSDTSPKGTHPTNHARDTSNNPLKIYN